MKAKSMAIQETRADRVFRTVVYAILGVLLVVYVYPLYFVVIASISDPNAVYNGEVLFYPPKSRWKDMKKSSSIENCG